MKRVLGCVVVDSDEEEVKRAKIDVVPTIRAATPHDHHDIHPGGLSPFKAQEIVVSEFPQGDLISVRDYYKQYIERTDAECDEEAAAPQRSLKWKEARKFALTASDFGAAAGDNPYSTISDVLKKKLWGTFNGNDATKWGTFCEPKASEAFLEWARANLDPKARLHELNLTKWSKTPWLAVSPDGVLEYTKDGALQFDLVEYKCPTRTFTETHPYSKYKNNTPLYYYDQMLGIWGLTNENGGMMIEGTPRHLGRAWFVVWQPKTLWITTHDFMREEYDGLFLKLRNFYFGKFLPALVWLHNGLLAPGEIEPALLLDLSQGGDITNGNHLIDEEVHEELDRDESGGSRGNIRIESSSILEE